MLPVLPPYLRKATQLSLPAALPGTSLSLLIQINTYIVIIRNSPISCHPFLLSAFSLISSYKYKLRDCFILVTPVAQTDSCYNFVQLKESHFHFIVTLSQFKDYVWNYDTYTSIFVWKNKTVVKKKFRILSRFVKITSCKREKLKKKLW